LAGRVGDTGKVTSAAIFPSLATFIQLIPESRRQGFRWRHHGLDAPSQQDFPSLT
jgi:hypothetical protein